MIKCHGAAECLNEYIFQRLRITKLPLHQQEVREIEEVTQKANLE